MKNIALIIAGGVGARMNQDIPKQFLNVYDKPVIVYTMEAFQKHPEIDGIEVVCLDGWHDVLRAYAKQFGIAKLENVVSGGKNGQDSIRNGLYDIVNRHNDDDDIVLIHDGVRPFVTEDILNHSIETAVEMGSCVAGVPAKDTIKVCNGENIAVATPDRSTLWQIQTPQTFRKDLIMQAYQKAKAEGFVGTDDASLAEYSGCPVKVIMGSYRNIKITTKEDLLIGEAFLKEEQA
jgi:2-C-methyl-D-erythritol 4-phosphate cytidylyltransferase